MTRAEEFFLQHYPAALHTFTALPASGSARRNYVAKSGEETYIVTENNNVDENEAFIYLSNQFQRLHLPAPRIFAVSDDKTLYIQEFLGELTLSEKFGAGMPPAEKQQWAERVLDVLFQFQQQTRNQIDFSKTFEYSRYDNHVVSSDLFYFKFFFADRLEVPYHKEKLLREFADLADRIEAIQPVGLMFRDFQARNIMVNTDGTISFIDYQAAMQGPLMYDVVSFLWQAKAGFSEEQRLALVWFYLEKFPEEDRTALTQSLPWMRLIRNLQVLGAYGLRGLIENKSHFRQSILPALDNLQNLLTMLPLHATHQELHDLLKKLPAAYHARYPQG